MTRLSPGLALLVALALTHAGSACRNPAPPAGGVVAPGQPPVNNPAVALDPQATPPATPGTTPTPTPSQPGAGGACSLAGRWAGRIPPSPSPFANSPVTADYRADNTVQWGTDMARFTGTWRVTGASLAITDTSSTIPTAACPSTVTGQYALEFTPACDAVTFRRTADECEGRRLALTDLALRRAP